jgi:hypothetical protein
MTPLFIQFCIQFVFGFLSVVSRRGTQASRWLVEDVRLRIEFTRYLKDKRFCDACEYDGAY